MSSTQIENQSSLEIGSSKTKKATVKVQQVLTQRKYLKTLQLSSAEDGQLTRPGEAKSNKDGKKAEKTKSVITQLRKPLHIFEDPKPSSESENDSPDGSTTCECHCHKDEAKDSEEEVLDFMTSGTSLEEWRDLAEERRTALEESLIENEQLHFEVAEFKTQTTNLVQEVKELQEENRRLSQQRDYFTGILQTMVDDDDGSSQTTSDSALSESASTTEESS